MPSLDAASSSWIAPGSGEETGTKLSSLLLCTQGNQETGDFGILVENTR
jgi:hypothetical protein